MAAVYPLGIAQLAACLSKHEINAFDPNIIGDYKDELARIINEFSPELIGISFRNLDTAQSYDPVGFLPDLSDCLGFLKKHSPNAIISIGGPGFSLFPIDIMRRFPQIDFGFYLEADVSFPAFADSPGSISEIPGIYYRQEDEIKFSGNSEHVDLARLPVPRFEILPLEKYPEKSDWSIGIESKRGCILKCVHCVYPYFNNNGVTKKPLENLKQEIGRLVELGIKRFFFVDSVFNIPKSHSVDVCEMLKEEQFPIKWGAFFSESNFDEQFYNLTWDADCRLHHFSPDGISRRSVKSFCRPITLKDMKRAYRLASARKDGMVGVSFMAGSPGEGIRDWIEFSFFLIYLLFGLRIWRLSISFVRIYPHTRLWKMAVEQGVIGENDDLLPPKFYYRFPASLFRFIINPVGKLAKLVREFTHFRGS